LPDSLRKSSLPQPERDLVDLLPRPKLIRTMKMGGQNGPREEVTQEDFLLKRSVTELLEIIRTLRDDEILTITVMHGLPHLVEIERDGAL
jgi:hypothetical protein